MDKPTAQQIKSLRLKHSLTQQQCANMLHMTVQNFSAYEQDRQKMLPAVWELMQIKCERLK